MRLGLRIKLLDDALVVAIAAQIRIVLSTLERRPPNINGPITPTADFAEITNTYAESFRLRNYSSTEIVVELYSKVLTSP